MSTFKRDKYSSARGGYSRIVQITCRKCDAPLVQYQKDGPGNLRRMYLDRIIKPVNMVGLQNISVKEIAPLTCPECKELLGIPYIYQKEKRKAFRLFQDSVKKKIVKSER